MPCCINFFFLICFFVTLLAMLKCQLFTKNIPKVVWSSIHSSRSIPVHSCPPNPKTLLGPHFPTSHSEETPLHRPCRWNTCPLPWVVEKNSSKCPKGVQRSSSTAVTFHQVVLFSCLPLITTCLSQRQHSNINWFLNSCESVLSFNKIIIIHLCALKHPYVKILLSEAPDNQWHCINMSVEDFENVLDLPLLQHTWFKPSAHQQGL